MLKKILLVDDDKSLLRVTQYQLEQEGYEILTAEDGKKGWQLFSEYAPNLVLTDINMPQIDGIALIKKIRERDESVPIIVITAYGSIDNAIKVIQSGASDYLTKPFNIESLKFTIEKNLSVSALTQENQALKNELFARYNPENIIGQSLVIKEVLGLVEKLSKRDATTLILGESGTGKELIARAIHNRGQRKSKPFIAVNCASIPDNLIESELFGHVKGAFTGAISDSMGKFEAANGGTLFLDEIGDLNVDLQTKLLRVLQDKEFQKVGSNKTILVDVRIIAATHHDLEKSVHEGIFREDLYYRLNVVPIVVPPLRQRREDIPLLISHFINKSDVQSKIKLGSDALNYLTNYDWPGNIRELENLIERLHILYPGQEIRLQNLPVATVPQPTGSDSLEITMPEEGRDYSEIEKQVITFALQKNDYNQSKTAQYLKIPRHVLIYRMKKLNL